MPAVLLQAYKLLIKPKSADDDGRRREFILNVILCGSLLLSMFAVLSVVVNEMALKSAYIGESTVMSLVVVVLFGGLLAISRTGYYRFSAYVLTALYVFLSFYSLARWGISLAGGVLVLSLSLVMASILLGTLTGSVVTMLSCAVLMTMGYLQEHHMVAFDSAWMKTPGDFSDAIGFSMMLGVITLVSWLSNREIERSLKRAQRSEAALTKERDLLEDKVHERTRALELAQREQIMELSRFAEFGRLSSGIVHELVTPLTTVSLNLEQMRDQAGSEKLQRAIESTKRMERYIQAARKQLQNQSVSMEFELGHEIESALEFLGPQARKQKVKLEFLRHSPTSLTGNPIRFHQLVTNLVSNAIAAYTEECGDHPRQVWVELAERGGQVQLAVKDKGCGIPPEHLGRVFEPFFTLKSSDHGMGLGLSLTKEIVEQDFGGTIKVSSEKSAGTVFTVRLPLRHKGRG